MKYNQDLTTFLTESDTTPFGLLSDYCEHGKYVGPPENKLCGECEDEF